MTIHDVDTLYECKGCGVLVRNTTGGCPNCGKTGDGTVKRAALDGGTVEKKRPWYNTLRLTD